MFPKGSMYLYSRYLNLKRGPFIGTLRPKYILYGYMEPEGSVGNRLGFARFVSLSLE